MALEQNKIDYDGVLEVIGENFHNIISDEESGIYEGLEIKITSERMFIKKKKEDLEQNKNTIYVVVKFQPASVTYGQTVLPISIIALAEYNGKNICYKLFQDYANYFNLEQNGSIKQYYESPVISSNFDEMYTGFMSVVSMSGVMIISENANTFDATFIYTELENGQEVEKRFKIQSLQNDFDLNLQLDPQPFFSTNNYTRSIVKLGTITVNFICYFLKNDIFLRKILQIAARKKTDGNVNETFVVEIEWESGEILRDNFKIAHFAIKQVLKELPVATITITN